MRAYKWLEAGARDPWTGRTWSSDGWTRMSKWSFHFVEQGGMASLENRRGNLSRVRSRAHAADQVARGMSAELWEVELAGDVKREEDGLLARKGRLLQPVPGWNETTAKRVAEEWIPIARDFYAAALRAMGDEKGAAQLGVALAGAEGPAAVGTAAAAVRDHTWLLPWVMTIERLIAATDAYAREHGTVAAQKAREARLGGAAALAALTEPDSGYREDQATNEYAQTAKRAYGREYVRMSEDLRVRLGLPMVTA